MWWAILSWAAVIIGLYGTWLAARHPTGWALGCACNALWAAFDIAFGIWAGLVQAIIGLALSLRNYYLTRRRR
ncbi:MAG TPA: hypothetical protein VFH56_02900 [Acidimicrobiales bacterium]|nr:hypothetical protein [Acidimicrobiales bacterium]